MEARVEEVALLQKVREERAAAENNNNNPRYDRGNVFVVREIVRITNHPQNKFGTVGVVTTSGKRFVEIFTSSRKYYTRAYGYIEYPICARNDDD